MRIFWDLRNLLESRWIFPIGQSGHPASPTYAHFRWRWFGGAMIRVFGDGSTWDGAGR